MAGDAPEDADLICRARAPASEDEREAIGVQKRVVQFTRNARGAPGVMFVLLCANA
jgi:hypothetical protein